MNKLYSYVYKNLSKILFRIDLYVKGITQPKKITVYGLPIISRAPGSKLCIGENLSMVSNARFTDLGVSKPCIIKLKSAQAVIVIGDDTGLSGTTICSAKQVSIGKNCLIGADVMIFDTDFHAIKSHNRRYNSNSDDIISEPVAIGDNVFIGTRSIIMKGVQIGDNSIIAAGSIVTKSIPSNVIAAGTPARVVKSIME